MLINRSNVSTPLTPSPSDALNGFQCVGPSSPIPDLGSTHLPVVEGGEGWSFISHLPFPARSPSLS